MEEKEGRRGKGMGVAGGGGYTDQQQYQLPSTGLSHPHHYRDFPNLLTEQF